MIGLISFLDVKGGKMNKGSWYLDYKEMDTAYHPSSITREKLLKAKDEESATLEAKEVWAQTLSDWSSSPLASVPDNKVHTPLVVYKAKLKGVDQWSKQVLPVSNKK